MRQNRSCETSRDSQGAVRTGAALLTGVSRCGHCGRKLQVYYAGGNGLGTRYICRGALGVGPSTCLGVPGVATDQAISREIVRAISPIGIEASMRACSLRQDEVHSRERALRGKLEQLAFEALRAFEQYNPVDPRNRLVAAELEARWNHKLKEKDEVATQLRSLELQTPKFSEEESQRLQYLDGFFEEVWARAGGTPGLRKKIVRCVVDEVIIRREPGKDIAEATIRWKGGAHTQLQYKLPNCPKKRTPQDAVEMIRKMAARYGDDEIARVLNKLRKKTAKGLTWNESRVYTIRCREKIKGQRKRTESDDNVLTLNGAARYLGVSDTTITKLGKLGALPYKQIVPYAPWEIMKSDLDDVRIQQIVRHLKATGTLRLPEVSADEQPSLFEENQGVSNVAHRE